MNTINNSFTVFTDTTNSEILFDLVEFRHMKIFAILITTLKFFVVLNL